MQDDPLEEQNLDTHTESINPIQDPGHDHPHNRITLDDRKLRSIIIGSLLAGAIGGVLGVYLFTGFMTGQPGDVLTRDRVVVNEESAVIDVVGKTKPAIVSIVGTKKAVSRTNSNDFFFFFPVTPAVPEETEERQVSAGTGFFVRGDGLVATNKHVVSDEAASYKVLTNDGKTFNAQVVGRDPVNDIALLKIEGNGFPILNLGDSDNIKVGQRVIAIGNALGQFTNTVTTGVVSGINRNIVATGQSAEVSQIEGAIQTDAAINPGNSGGPLLDLSGEVIGINTAISSQGQLLGFAIPVSDLKKDIQVYGSRKAIVKPFIGVRYIMITETLQKERSLGVDRGAFITSGNSREPAVVPNGPADKAGLKDGDIILKVAGREINLEHSLAAAIRNLDPGQTVELAVFHDGREMKMNITLGERRDE